MKLSPQDVIDILMHLLVLGMQAAQAHFLKREQIMPEGNHSHTLLQETSTVRHAASNLCHACFPHEGAVLCLAAALTAVTLPK